MTDETKKGGEILWAVYTNSDLTEGRGREFVKHFCAFKATALRLAKRGYVQGSDCPVRSVEVFLLEGKRVLPASIIQVVKPTALDDEAQAAIDRRDAAIEKARAAGMTDDDIRNLTGAE